MNAQKFAVELVKISSVSGEERSIGEYIYNRLKKNFCVRKQRVGNRFNILATIGKPDLLLTTHMDTVPGNLKVWEDDKYIYGRGSCDAKGPLAAMVIAAEESVKEGYTNFGLLIDVGEEIDFSGILSFNRDAINPKFVIIGEPTASRIIAGQKGLIGLKIIFSGKAAHGSTPQKGISAILKCISAARELEKASWPKNKTLGNTTINIGMIHGGSAPNMVPESAEIFIEIRSTTNSTRVMQIINRVVKRHENSNISLEYKFEPVLPIQKKYTAKIKTYVAPYFTEMYFWRNKSIVLGPGDPRYAHSSAERIQKTELEKAVVYYKNFIKLFQRKQDQ